jgi:CheY-like chemotaxis protein
MATVLIVEDQEEILTLVQSFLEEQGHKTLSAATADAVDIILNGDMQAGLELAKRAVELKPRLNVVYSTGLSVTDDMKALFVPGSAVLEKPYTVDQLLTSFFGPFSDGSAASRSRLATYELSRLRPN